MLSPYFVPSPLGGGGSTGFGVETGVGRKNTSLINVVVRRPPSASSAGASDAFSLQMEGEQEAAKDLGVDLPGAARAGVAEAIRQAMIANDIAAYKRNPEVVDPFWLELEEWSS